MTVTERNNIKVEIRGARLAMKEIDQSLSNLRPTSTKNISKINTLLARRDKLVIILDELVSFLAD